MKFKLLSFSLIISLLGCSGPKFVGFQSSFVKTKTTEVKSKAKPNFVFESELMNKVEIPVEITQLINTNSPIFVSNYNLFPFNAIEKATDSSKAIYKTKTDQNINQELGIKLEKQLISKKFIVLENEEIYNLFDNNVDEYETSLNFELKRFGLYYERSINNVVIRHGECDVRFRVLNKNGQLKYISDQIYTHQDTISEDDISSVSSPRMALGYSNTYVDHKLTNYSSPELGGNNIPSIYTKPPVENIDSVEVITGAIFKLPSETKVYTIWVFDNAAVQAVKASKGTQPITTADLLKLSPMKLQLKSNNSVVTKASDGTTSTTYESIISFETLNEFFINSNEIILFYKAKPIKALRRYNDGSIRPLN